MSNALKVFTIIIVIILVQLQISSTHAASIKTLKCVDGGEFVETLVINFDEGGITLNLGRAKVWTIINTGNRFHGEKLDLSKEKEIWFAHPGVIASLRNDGFMNVWSVGSDGAGPGVFWCGSGAPLWGE